MIINGDKIIIRAIEKEDNDMLLSMLNDPDMEKMLGGSSWPISQIEQECWFDSQISRQTNIKRGIIALKSDNQAIGTIILSDIDQKNGTAEIHIKLLNKKYGGRGYGSDAVKTMVQYAFNEMRLNCIYALILVHNEASVKLFEKCGFSKEGILRARVYKLGQYLDQYSYSIARNE